MDQKKTQPDQQTIDEILNLFKSGKLNNAKIKIENCIKMTQLCLTLIFLLIIIIKCSRKFGKNLLLNQIDELNFNYKLGKFIS